MLLTLQAIKEDNLKHIPAADQNTKSLLPHPHTAKLMVCINSTQTNDAILYWDPMPPGC